MPPRVSGDISCVVAPREAPFALGGVVVEGVWLENGVGCGCLSVRSLMWGSVVMICESMVVVGECLVCVELGRFFILILMSLWAGITVSPLMLRAQEGDHPMEASPDGCL